MKIKELYDYGRKNLPESCESLILCEELYGVSRTDIICHPDMEIKDSDKFFDAVNRRNNAEPLQYILGYWYFDDLKLNVKDGVLIPREDTMVLVNCAIDFIGDKKLKGVDLCSGTGAVALGIKNHCENVTINALELFEIPYSCLRENIEAHKSNIKPEKRDVLKDYDLYEDLDFIVSNPPYIETKEIETLQIEVQNEPHTALDGGEDGLVFYRVICDKWSQKLKSHGLLAFEIGETQGEDVSKLMLENGFENVEVVKDFNNLPRVVWGIKK